jgi:serine/threonine protein kinase
MNDQKSGFMRKYNEMDYSSPLSPQALKALMVGPESGSYDKEKNDIWSLGITFLSTFVNEDYNNYYDWKNYRVNDTLIRSRILKLSKDYGYSYKLINVIERMLETDDFNRIGITELSRTVGVTRGGGYNNDVESMYKGAIGGGDFLKNLKKVSKLFSIKI